GLPGWLGKEDKAAVIPDHGRLVAFLAAISCGKLSLPPAVPRPTPARWATQWRCLACPPRRRRRGLPARPPRTSWRRPPAQYPPTPPRCHRLRSHRTPPG